MKSLISTIIGVILVININAQGINILTNTFVEIDTTDLIDSTSTFEKFDVPQGNKRLLILWSDLQGRSDIIADANLNGNPMTTFLHNVRVGPLAGVPNSVLGGGHQFWYATLGSGDIINECIITMTRSSGLDVVNPYSPATPLRFLYYMVLDNVDQSNPIGLVQSTNDTYAGTTIGGLSWSFSPQLYDKIISLHSTAAATPACLPGTCGIGDSLVHNIPNILQGNGGSAFSDVAVSSFDATEDGVPVDIEWIWYDRMTDMPQTTNPVYFLNESFEINFCRSLIPTMGQWGIICLSLFMLIIGTLTIRQKQKNTSIT